MKDYGSYTPINADYSFGTRDRAYYLVEYILVYTKYKIK